MKKFSLPIAIFYTLLISSCNVRLPAISTPKPSVEGNLENIKLINGFPEKNEPWIVISDRDNNSVFMEKGSQKSPQEIQFLKPLLVVKHNKNKNLLKVAEFTPDALLQKIPKKSIKTYGWIPKDQLLLWQNAMSNNANGFTIKATLVPNDLDVLNNPEKYLNNDSIILYNSPISSKPLKNKLPVGSLAYIYKTSDNGKRSLIGKTPTIKLDSISTNIYGWVSNNMIAYWGENSAIRLNDSSKFDSIYNSHEEGTHKPIYLTTDKKSEETLHNIFPTNVLNNNNNETIKQTKYFDHAFDYSKNFIYNVLGDPLYYNRYKEITQQNKNLNLFFVLDNGNNSNKTKAIALTLLQDFHLKIQTNNYYKSVKYGVALFNQNNCGNNVKTFNLTNNIDELTEFINQNNKTDNCPKSGAQPLQDGLVNAGNILSNYSDETNLIIVIGSTSPTDNQNQSIRSLTKANAKLLFFQTHSGTSTDFNNFVLAAENVVSNTAKNIALLRQEKIVEQNEIINKNNYELKLQDGGYYSLDYPKTSMTQGMVIYPKKGEISSNNLLSQALDSLTLQVTHENINTEKSLTNYFKSKIGTSRTRIKERHINMFSSLATSVPTQIASELFTYERPFLFVGNYDQAKNDNQIAEKGILISEIEYENLKNLYLEIYNKTIKNPSGYSQSKAINNYLKIINNQKTTFSNKKINKTQNMAYTIAVSTGYDSYEDEKLSTHPLKNWKKKKHFPNAEVKTYFGNYMILADRLMENKNNPKIQINQNGETFYWLNEYYFPKSINLYE